MLGTKESGKYHKVLDPDWYPEQSNKDRFGLLREVKLYSHGLKANGSQKE